MTQNTELLQWKKDILPIFPPHMAAALEKMETAPAGALEEIRVRVEQPLALSIGGENFFFSAAGKVLNGITGAYISTVQDCQEILVRASRHSVYSLEEEMRRGFITLKGGYRMGIGGKTVLDKGRVRLISPCTFFNIRIARQFIGCAKALFPRIANRQKIFHTLLVSPPQMGKTTMLRDIARALADGETPAGPQKVAIIDERSEIAGCYNGIAQNNVGSQTDVLDGCPKAEGIMMALRGLSPRVIVTDEIGRKEDVDAVTEAANAGVAVITSAHGSSLEELQRRPGMAALLKTGAFERIVLLGGGRPGRIAGVYDGAFRPLGERKE